MAFRHGRCCSPLPPRALARGGVGSGVGGSAAFTEMAVPADSPKGSRIGVELNLGGLTSNRVEIAVQ